LRPAYVAAAELRERSERSRFVERAASCNSLPVHLNIRIMKSLVAGGSVFINSTPRFSRGRRFDWWPKHSIYISNVDVQELDSGGWVCFIVATLTNLQTFYYPSVIVSDEVEAVNIQNDYKTFQSSNQRVGFFGEWYNHTFRANAFDKIASSDWAEWVRTH